MRKQTKLWTTKDGRRLRICDMTDAHLSNTLALLRRTAEVLRAKTIKGYCCSGPTADMASRAFEQEQDAAFESTWEDYLPDIYDAMIEDMERRAMQRKEKT